MAVHTIPAETTVPTEGDLHKRKIVEELIKSQNHRIIDFAKHLVTISFSAIGIVLTLKHKWFGADAPYDKSLLGIAIALFLGTGLLATLASTIYIHRVSLSDYADVYEELHRVARKRHNLTRLAFILSVIATIIVAIVALRA